MIIEPNELQWKFDRSQHLESFNARYSKFEENSRLLLRKVNFAFMIPNRSQPGLFLRCSLFLAKFEPPCSYKIVLIKKACIFMLRLNVLTYLRISASVFVAFHSHKPTGSINQPEAQTNRKHKYTLLAGRYPCRQESNIMLIIINKKYLKSKSCTCTTPETMLYTDKYLPRNKVFP